MNESYETVCHPVRRGSDDRTLHLVLQSFYILSTAWYSEQNAVFRKADLFPKSFLILVLGLHGYLHKIYCKNFPIISHWENLILGAYADLVDWDCPLIEITSF
jgi:hypothetical protein